MKIPYSVSGKSFPASYRYIIYAIVAMLISIFNFVLLDFISFGGMTPDLMLILCIWIALKEGQFVGVFAGFGSGLLFDIVSLGVIGTNALSKTIAAFIAGWFHKENNANQIIGSYRFLVITFICSFFHNLIYFFLYIKSSEISFFSFLIKYGIAVSLYTTVFAIFPMLTKIPRKEFS